MRRAAILTGALLLTGCSAPATGPAAVSTPAPSASVSVTASPEASPSALVGFSIPDTCDGLLPEDAAASFASQGLVGGEIAVYPDVAIGDPLPMSDFDTFTETDVVMTDYRFCEWVGGGRTVDIFVGRADAQSRALTVSEFWSLDRRIDRNAPVVVFTFDGNIPGVGDAGASHWVVRTNSVIKVDIDPGGESVRLEALALEEQIAAHLRAD